MRISKFVAEAFSLDFCIFAKNLSITHFLFPTLRPCVQKLFSWFCFWVETIFLGKSCFSFWFLCQSSHNLADEDRRSICKNKIKNIKVYLMFSFTTWLLSFFISLFLFIFTLIQRKESFFDTFKFIFYKWFGSFFFLKTRIILPDSINNNFLFLLNDFRGKVDINTSNFIFSHELDNQVNIFHNLCIKF